VDLRYRYFYPLNLSCRHRSEGGGVCVVDLETVVCRHPMGPRIDGIASPSAPA
jgi:hypothetical protein